MTSKSLSIGDCVVSKWRRILDDLICLLSLLCHTNRSVSVLIFWLTIPQVAIDFHSYLMPLGTKVLLENIYRQTVTSESHLIAHALSFELERVLEKPFKSRKLS